MTMIWLESTTGGLIILSIYTILTGYALMLGGEEKFEAINDCTCEGCHQIYECRVTGTGASVWRGSAFDCPEINNEINLLHSSQNIEESTFCNNQAIVGQIIRVENNSTYISQLNISVGTEIDGKNISCFHDNNDISKQIGSSLLTLTRDPYPPPDDVHLMEANSSQLIFQWSIVSSTRQTVNYLINASNCGHCPDITNTTTTTCHIMGQTSLDGDVCNVAIQTVVCDNITGNESREVLVNLKVLDAPTISVIPTYTYNNKTLSGVITRFDETETFNISDGFNGSALFYTLKYTDSNSSAPCISEEISATSCVNGSCQHDYNVFPLPCLTSSINLTVSGTNILGEGPPSSPVTIPKRSDQFVIVSVDLASKTVTCEFRQQRENSSKYCGVEYGLSRENCKSQNWSNTSISDDWVFIDFHSNEEFQPQQQYCFTVTARNETFTVLIEGAVILDALTHSGNTLGTVATITVLIIIITVSLLGLVVVVIFMIVKKRQKIVHKRETQFTNQATILRSQQAANNNEVEEQRHNETSEQVMGIYSLLQSVGDETSDSQTEHHEPVYVDIGPITTSQENTQKFLVPVPYDDKVEYAEVKETENRKHNTSESSESEAVLLDKYLNLDNLLIQLRDDVTPHWYELGLTVGVPKEVMDKFKDYPPEQCIVEVLDYWLVHCSGQLTWRDVAHAVKEIQFHHLAEYIIQNSETL